MQDNLLDGLQDILTLGCRLPEQPGRTPAKIIGKEIMHVNRVSHGTKIFLSHLVEQTTAETLKFIVVILTMEPTRGNLQAHHHITTIIPHLKTINLPPWGTPNNNNNNNHYKNTLLPQHLLARNNSPLLPPVVHNTISQLNNTVFRPRNQMISFPVVFLLGRNHRPIHSRLDRLLRRGVMLRILRGGRGRRGRG